MSLRADCEGIVPAPLLPFVPGRFDVVGDIAILSLPDSLLPFSAGIARAIVSRRKNIKTIVRKISKTEGEHRVARFEFLTGSSTETAHRENGFLYKLDIRETFFAPRLASERKTVCGKVRPGEQVLIPFAGVGPFVIPVAAEGATVTAVERNPEAFRFLKENVAVNDVAGHSILIKGDAFDRLLYPQEYDRAIIPAPYGQDGILDLLAPLVKYRGMIHFYRFSKQEELPAIFAGYRSKGLQVMDFRRCGNVAPRVSRWAFDLCAMT